MTTLFISDLHLDSQHPELTQLFIGFLQTQARHAQTLYILGDFFEVWIGDDEASPLQVYIADQLRQLTEHGVQIFIMHGNRDFLLGQQFAQAAGCQLIPDPCVINLYGVSTLLMHGDSLCIADKKYKLFRGLVRQAWLQKLFLALPIKLREKIAQRMRQASSSHTRDLDAYVMDSDITAIIKAMQQYKVKLLIHGHTHRPSLHLFQTETWLEQIVLSDWHTNQGNVLVCHPDGRRILQYF